MWGSGGFVPVGDSSNRFTGSIDGQKHAILGLTINRPTTDGVGLFGATSNTAVIQKVGLEGGSVVGLEIVGMLVGDNQGAVSYSNASGTVKGMSSTVGGLVGRHGFGAGLAA